MWHCTSLQELAKDKDANKEDKLAVAGRLRDLAKEQVVLQAKLHGIQSKICRSTRELMSDQRCRDVWHLVDELWSPPGSGAEDSQLVSSGAAEVGPGMAAQAQRGGKASRPGGSGEGKAGGSNDDDAVVNHLQLWVDGAAEHLHESTLARMLVSLEQQLKQLEAEKAQEAHFLRELQGQSGGQHAKKGIHSSPQKRVEAILC